MSILTSLSIFWASELKKKSNLAVNLKLKFYFEKQNLFLNVQTFSCQEILSCWFLGTDFLQISGHGYLSWTSKWKLIVGLLIWCLIKALENKLLTVVMDRDNLVIYQTLRNKSLIYGKLMRKQKVRTLELYVWMLRGQTESTTEETEFTTLADSPKIVELNISMCKWIDVINLEVQLIGKNCWSELEISKTGDCWKQ